MENQKVYGPLTLPSGKEIYFRKAMRSDRTEATIMQDFENTPYGVALMQVDETVQASCLVKIDGNNPSLNPKDRFDDWEDTDVEYYSFIFNKMFGIDEEKKKKAAEQAAFLLKNSTSMTGFNSMDSSVTIAG